MESKIVNKGRRGVLSHLTRKSRQEMSYIWTNSTSLEDAFFRYADSVGDIVTEGGELILTKYAKSAIEEYMQPDIGLRESGRRYLSKLVDGMEAMARHTIISGNAPFESVFDIYNEPFVEWYSRLDASNETLKITQPPATKEQIKCRESSRIVLLSKIASSHSLMMMGIIPMRAMEVG